MAVRGQEVEVLGPGIESDSEVKGAFALNMLWRRNGWEVRKGFGQVAEMDTTLGAIKPNAEDLLWGYRNHMGSYLMKTSLGGTQIISAFSADVTTGDRYPSGEATPNQGLSEFLRIYVVSIYDVDSGEWWEEPVYSQTSEFVQSGTSAAQMPTWRGQYESVYRLEEQLVATTFFLNAPNSGVENFQKWKIAEHDDEAFFFVEQDDLLFFGNRDTGLLSYAPSVFRGWRKGGQAMSRRGREMQAQTVYDKTWANPYSEGSLVTPAPAFDGAFSDAFTYLNRSEFPQPQGGSVLQGRLVLFSGKSVYFSDVGFPTSIVAENILFVASEGDITAVQEHLGNLLIFTDEETWVLQPADAFIVTQGRLVKLAEGLGCLSANSISKTSSSVTWMDRRGAYTMESGFSIEKISDKIEPFFNDFISNPLTSYYTANGNPTEAASEGAQPSPTVSLKSRNLSVVYYHKLKCTLFCMPDASGALYYRDGKWGWWTVESVVQPEYVDAGIRRPIVGAAQNIRNPWMLADNDNLFVVGSPNDSEQGEPLTNTIAGRAGAVITADNTRSRSYYLLRYGLGGGVDRSVESGEDRRQVVGRWAPFFEQSTAIVPGNSDHYLYMGKPVPIPQGSVLGVGASASPAADAVDGAVWVPFEYVRGEQCNTASQFSVITAFNIRFSYDTTKWQPILQSGSTTAVQVFLPPERMAGTAGWSVVKSQNAGVPSAVGTYLQIGFAAGGGGGAPSPNFRLWNRNRLIWIPFKPVDQSQVVGMGVDFDSLGVGIGGVAQVLGNDLAANPCTADMRCYVWEETRLGSSQHQDNNVAQAVDWAYKSAPVGAKDDVQIKGRGLSLVAMSHGTAFANNRIQPEWPFGLMNVIGGADYKEWTSQVVDVIPTSDAVNTQSNIPAVILDQSMSTLRTRYKTNATAALVETVFNKTDGPKYGAQGGTASSYDYIVGDEEVDMLAISDSVRGEKVSYMLWGHVQNKAERFFLQSMKTIIRVLGGTRRTGR